MEAFCATVASLHAAATNAHPTAFHRWMAALAKDERLLRAYSQNIDGLEEKAGLVIYDPTRGKSTSPARGTAVLLHGTAMEMCCSRHPATHRMSTAAHATTLASGVLPICPLCQDEEQYEGVRTLRPRPNGKLRPRILLYNEGFLEDHGDVYHSMLKKDAASTDMVVVAGSSLRIPGMKAAIQIMSRALRSKNSRLGLRTIYVNKERPPAELLSAFDVWVECDVEMFARTCLEL